MIAERFPEIDKLSREEKMLLACELWDENPDFTLNPDTEDALEDLLSILMKRFKESPEEGITWEDLKKKYERN